MKINKNVKLFLIVKYLTFVWTCQTLVSLGNFELIVKIINKTTLTKLLT